MHQHRPFGAVGRLEGAHHRRDVVAVDRAHVGETQLLEDGPQLGNRQPLHALLERLELGGQFAVQEGKVANRLFGVVLQELHRLAQPHAVEVGGEGAHRRTDRHVVVVEHHQQIGARQVPGVVDRLQGHATGEGAIADHGDAAKIFTAGIAGQGHAQGGRDAGGGVAGAEVVEAAFAALEITGHPTPLPQGVELAVATGDQLVGIGLVTDIPDHLVAVEVEGLIEGEGELHHPQARPEVTAAGGDHLEVLLTDLAGDRLEFRGTQTVQLIRVIQLAEVHDHTDLDLGNLRGPFWRTATTTTVCPTPPPRRPLAPCQRRAAPSGRLPHWGP